MKKVTITYPRGNYKNTTFTAKELFYKTEFGWLREIGYCPEGKNRKKWFPIGGRCDDNNDYSDTIVEIKEVSK